MPPGEMPRPDESTYIGVLNLLERSLDEIAAEHPRPSRTDTFRRLTRTEYQNAIRDLLSVNIDATKLLPADESSHGFDNVTVGELSPTLLNRYITAAQKSVDWRSAAGSHPQAGHVPHSTGCHPGTTCRRTADRHAWRSADSVQFPAGR